MAEVIMGDAWAMRRVHHPSLCFGRPCVIHAPSMHPMRFWPLWWRSFGGYFERICPHGIGHPDPDDVAYHESIGKGWIGEHACDGCCTAAEHPPVDWEASFR